MTIGCEENSSSTADSEYIGESSCYEESNESFSCCTSSFVAEESTYQKDEHSYNITNLSSAEGLSELSAGEFRSSSINCERDNGSINKALSEDNDDDVKSRSRMTSSTDSCSTVRNSALHQDLHYYVLLEGKLPDSLCERNKNSFTEEIESTTSSLTVSSCSSSEYTSDDESEIKYNSGDKCSQRSDTDNQGTDSCESDTSDDNDFEFLLDQTKDPDILDTFTMMDLSSSGSQSTKENLAGSIAVDSNSQTSGALKRRCLEPEYQRKFPELDDKSSTEKKINPSRPQKLRRLYSMSSTVGSSCHKFLRLLQDNNCHQSKSRREEQSISRKSTTTSSSFWNPEDDNEYDEKTSQIFF